MPRIKKFNKGQFHGNRYTSNESKARPNPSSPGSSKKQSSSSKKLSTSKLAALQSNTPYTHKKSIPEPIMTAIKPIYYDLTKDSLLKRCLHGKTQNPNESFNSYIWQRIPKSGFVGLETLTLGVTDAVITFNEGSIVKANVLERMGIKPGKFTVEGLKLIDRERILKADKEVQEQNKKKSEKEAFKKEERRQRQ